MYRRQRAASTKAPAQPTRTRILEAAVRVMNEDGFDRFNVKRVLELAGVSRATLYNHFQDVDALIEAALVETFDQELRQSVTTISGILAESSDRQAFRKALRQFVDGLARIPTIVRLRRTHTIALTSTRPALAAAVSVVQEGITDAFEMLLRTSEARGFTRVDLDLRAVAVLLQAASVGRIIDDATTDRINDKRWAAVYFDFIDRTLLLPDDEATPVAIPARTPASRSSTGKPRTRNRA